jgi:tetratricopeptide (TPR) repeat protein
MTQGLTGGAIELSGTAATLVLLVPFLALLAVVWRTVRAHHRRTPRQTSLAQGVATIAGLPAEAPLDERIAKALARGDDGALAGLYLLKAREASSAGDASRATELLRNSIRCAQRSGNASIHADARLDLAEIARAAGDLTTACEHWQLARKLFYDLARKDRLAEADALMLRHGCPTDWVLTDF